MKKELNNFMAKVPINLVRQLYEYPNANPEFETLVKPKNKNQDSDDVCVIVNFTCDGQRWQLKGNGANKKNAKRNAAKLALSKLERSTNSSRNGNRSPE